MRAYASVFKLRLYQELQYRTAALAGIATQFFWGSILIMVFVAFYSHAAVEPNLSLTQLVTYIWLQQAFIAIIMLWFYDDELFDMITSGNIAYELCRPLHLYGLWYAKVTALRLARAMLRCIPILTIPFFLPAPYRMSPPAGWHELLLFVIAMGLSLLMVVAITMLIYISVFVTLSPTGSMMMFGIVGQFCSGMVIPLPLMPDWLRPIITALPFHLTADFPFRVYSGHIPPEAAWPGVLTQVIWLVMLVMFGLFALHRILKRVVVQGG